MSGEDPKEGGQAGGEFVWLAPDLSVARNGRTLFPGCIHEADNFKPDVVAYWIKTGAARWATAEDIAAMPKAPKYKAGPQEMPPSSGIFERGYFYPRVYYFDGAEAVLQPSLFPQPLFRGNEKKDSEDLNRLQDKIAKRAGFPPVRLNTELTEKQIDRLYEFDKEYFVPLIQDALIEIADGGDSRASRIKWFWFVNVLNNYLFYENRFEQSEITAAENAEEKRARRREIIIDSFRKTADLFGIQLTNLSAEWTGEKSVEAILRRPGFQEAITIYERVLYQTPLRGDGFIQTETADGVIWEKQLGRRRLQLKTAKITGGDIARRTFHALVILARERQTDKPGPILFEEVLKLIGQENCNQEERERIREYLLAAEKTSLTVIETDPKTKKNIWHDYAPLLKRFKWEGGTEGGAKLFPIFNEQFPQVWQATKQYVYIPADRMRGLPRGRTEREHYVLDFFRLRLGMPCIKRKMKAFLLDDAQLSEDTLKEWGIKKIKKMVSDWFELAKSEGLVREYLIDESGGRREYLEQIIRYYPTKGTAPRIYPKETEIRRLVNDIIEWIYNPDNKQYVKTLEKQSRQELRGAIRSLGVDHVREVWERTGEEREGEGDEYSPWLPGTSRYMDFWNLIKADLAGQREPKRRGKK